MLTFWVGRRHVSMSLCASICLQSVTPVLAGPLEGPSQFQSRRIPLFQDADFAALKGDSLKSALHQKPAPLSSSEWHLLSHDRASVSVTLSALSIPSIASGKVTSFPVLNFNWDSKNDANPLTSSYLWMGEKASFVFGDWVLEWLAPSILKLSGNSLSETIPASPALHLDAPQSSVMLSTLSLDTVHLNVASATFGDGVTIENLTFSGAGHIPSKGSLTCQNLTLEKGQVVNEGRVLMDQEGALTLSSHALLHNKGVFDYTRSTHMSVLKGRGTFLNDGTLAFGDAVAFDGINLHNSHLITAPFSTLLGSLSSLTNTGTFHASHLEDLGIHTFSNSGSFKGFGELNLYGASENRGNLWGDLLTLHIESTFTSHSPLTLKELMGSGKYVNHSTLNVLSPLNSSLSFTNQGLIKAPSYIIKGKAPRSAEGQWKLKTLTLENPTTLDGVWDIDELFGTSETTLVNQGELTLNTIRGQIPFTNEGMLRMGGGKLFFGDLHNTSSGQMTGHGDFVCKEALNEGIIEGVPFEAFSSSKQILRFFSYGDFVNQNRFMAWSVSCGSLNYKSMYPSLKTSHVLNHGSAEFFSLGGKTFIQNTGHVKLKTFNPFAESADSFISGNWHLGSFSLPPCAEPYTIRGSDNPGESLTIDSLSDMFFNQKSSLSKGRPIPSQIITQGNVTIKDLPSTPIPFVNEGTLTLESRFTCFSLNTPSFINKNTLKGTGIWNIKEFLNEGTFHSHGQHTIQGETFTNIGSLLSDDSDHILKLIFSKLINGLPASVPYFTVDEAKNALAMMHTLGKIEIQSQHLLDNRHGGIYGKKALTVKGEAELLNGSGVQTSTVRSIPGHSASGSFQMRDSRFGSCTLQGSGLSQSSSFRHPFFLSNGAFMATEGEIKLSGKKLLNTYGSIFAHTQNDLSKSCSEFIFSGSVRFEDGTLYAQETLIKTPLLEWLSAASHAVQVIYHPVPCWKIYGNCPDYFRTHYLEQSNPARGFFEHTLDLKADHMKVEGAELYVGGKFLLNGVEVSNQPTSTQSFQVLDRNTGRKSILKVHQEGEIHTIFAKVTGNASFQKLVLETFTLYLESNPSLFRKPLPALNDVSSESISGCFSLTQAAQNLPQLTHQNVSGQTALLWERPLSENEVRFWGERASPSFAPAFSLASLPMTPQLLDFLVTKLSLQHRRGKTHALRWQALLEKGCQIAESIQEGRALKEKEETPQALIPYSTDLSSFSHSSFLVPYQSADGYIDLILHMGEEKSSFQDAKEKITQASGALWADEKMTIHVREGVSATGGVLASFGESDTAIELNAKSIETSPVLSQELIQHSEDYLTKRDILGDRPQIMTPCGGFDLTAEDHQTHTALQFGAKTKAKFKTTNQAGKGIAFLEQKLTTQTTQTEIQDKSSWYQNKKLTITRTHTSQTAAVTEGICTEGDVEIDSASDLTTHAPKIAAKKKIHLKGKRQKHLAVELKTTSTTTYDKKGSWCSSSITDQTIQGSLLTPQFYSGEELTFEGDRALLEGAQLSTEHLINKTLDLILSVGRTSTSRLHTHDIERAVQSKDLFQEVGCDVLVPTEIQCKRFTSVLAEPGTITLQGVRGNCGVAELENTSLTLQDAPERSWATQRTSQSGLMGGPFEAEPLKLAIQTVRDGQPHASMINAAAWLNLANTAIGTVRDGMALVEGANSLVKGEFIAAAFGALSRYTTLTFGNQESSQSRNQITPFRSDITYDSFSMRKALLFSLQGRMVVKNKATFSEIDRFELKPSESHLEEQASQTSESVGLNPLSLSLNVGGQKGKNDLNHTVQSPAQLISKELEIDARLGHLQGGDIITQDQESQIHFDELIIEGIVEEYHATSSQVGWSIGVPLLPTGSGALSALNLFSGAKEALSAASALKSVATSVGGQLENSSQNRRKQVGLPKLYSVNPETGEIKPLQGTIGHLHTKVSVSSKDTVLEDTGLSEFEIGSHTHEILEEYDHQDRRGFAAPIGAMTGIYGNVSWISERLTRSPAAQAVATPEVMTKTLVEDVAQEATKTSRPERRKLERATKKFVAKESVKQDLETLHHANRVLAAAQEQAKGNAFTQTAPIELWSDQHSQWSVGNVQDMPLEQFLQTPLGTQRVSREEVEHAQTVASQAWGRIKNEASEFVENNPKASKAIGNFLWGAAEGLRGWYYFEAAKTGMLVGGAVAGPAGALFGGAAGLLMAYGTENVTQAATAGGIELAAQLVGGVDGQVIREAAPIALTALGLRAARKTTSKAIVSKVEQSVLKEGQVGTFGKLDKLRVVGDNLTPNHVPQAAYIKRHGVERKEGIAIMMDHPHPGIGGRHRQTRTYGKTPDFSLNPRVELGKDVVDLRKIYQKEGLYTPEMRNSLQNIIKENKQSFPHLFEKKGNK